jgi:hypothetical protein
VVAVERPVEVLGLLELVALETVVQIQTVQTRLPIRVRVAEAAAILLERLGQVETVVQE